MHSCRKVRLWHGARRQAQPRSCPAGPCPQPAGWTHELPGARGGADARGAECGAARPRAPARTAEERAQDKAEKQAARERQRRETAERRHAQALGRPSRPAPPARTCGSARPAAPMLPGKFRGQAACLPRVGAPASPALTKCLAPQQIMQTGAAAGGMRGGHKSEHEPTVRL